MDFGAGVEFGISACHDGSYSFCYSGLCLLFGAEACREVVIDVGDRLVVWLGLGSWSVLGLGPARRQVMMQELIL